MLRSTGHTIGYFALGGAGLCFYKAIVSEASRAAPLVGGVVLLGTGFHLLTKLYLSDPEAQKEYRQEIERMSFTEALRKYNLSGLQHLYDHDGVRSLFAAQFGLKGSLSHICKAMDLGALTELLKAGILTKEEALYRFQQDARAAETFTNLWSELCGHVPALAQLGCVDEALCRALLLSEYGWVDPAGNIQPSLQSSSMAPGAPLGLLQAINAYGSYAIKNLGVNAAFFQTILRTSPFGEDATAAHLLSQGLLTAHKNGFVDVVWYQSKFDVYVSEKRLDLWECERTLQLRDSLQHKLVLPESVAGLFHRAIPKESTISSGSVDCSRSNVIAFVEHWESELRAHPVFVEEKYRSTLAMLYRQYTDERQQIHDEIGRIQRQGQGRVEALRTEMNGKTKEDIRGRQAIQAKIDAEERSIERSVERERSREVELKAAQHRYWCQSRSGQLAPTTVVGASVSLACAQQ